MTVHTREETDGELYMVEDGDSSSVSHDPLLLGRCRPLRQSETANWTAMLPCLHALRL